MEIKNIKHQEGYFSGVEGYQLYYQRWYPVSPPQSIQVIIHGLGSHSSTFGNLVEFLGDRGYVVYAWDLRGHGRSPGQRGYINNWREFREDLRAFLQLIEAQENNLPLFLLGQSLGGTIALDYALHYRDRLNGLVLFAPALEVHISPIKLVLGRIFSQFIPRFSLNTGLDLTAGSRNSQIISAYLQDPLIHPKGTARLATEFFQTVTWIEKHTDLLQVPLLILHGGADKIAMPKSSRHLFDKITLADKEIHEYPQSYHELYNDLNYQDVLADIGDWLQKHLTLVNA
jgi:alpha-beta hydrolase superfamily lysophospholipase